MRKSSKSPRSGNSAKPAKPCPDFPFTAYASGRCCKKIKGRVHDFGRWGNEQGNRIVPVEAVDISARRASICTTNNETTDTPVGRRALKRDGMMVAELSNRS